MTAAGGSRVTGFDDRGVAAARAIAKWLRYAAAPTFAGMALLATVLDSGPPNALCSAGHLWPGGMTSMYFLMSVFHSAPWLRLIAWRRNIARYSRSDTMATLFMGVERPGTIQTMERKR